MTNDTKRTPAGRSFDTFYAGLRQLKADCGSNKHNQALMLIVACIEEGFDTGPRIIGVLKCLKMDSQHLGMILSGRILAGEASTLWRRDDDGKYIPLPTDETDQTR